MRKRKKLILLGGAHAGGAPLDPPMLLHGCRGNQQLIRVAELCQQKSVFIRQQYQLLKSDT